MFDLNRVMMSDFGSIFISVLLGLGLAALFRRACRGDGCVVVQAPDVSELRKNTYRTSDGNCYRYTPTEVSCPLFRTGVVRTV